jgi:hypothetical protein
MEPERRPTSIERESYLAGTRFWLASHWKTSLAVAVGAAMLLLNQRVTQQRRDRIAEPVEAIGLQAGSSDSPTPSIARPTGANAPGAARAPTTVPGEQTAALAGARTTETATDPEPAAQPARDRSTDKPGTAIDAAQEFLQQALRDPGRLTRIDFKSRPATAYCLVDPHSHEIHECLRRPALSGEVLASLNRAHKRSGGARFWRVDARRSSVEACRTVKTARSVIRRQLCKTVKVDDLPFPPPPPPPAPLTPLRSGEIEVARTSTTVPKSVPGYGAGLWLRGRGERTKSYSMYFEFARCGHGVKEQARVRNGLRNRSTSPWPSVPCRRT